MLYQPPHAGTRAGELIRLALEDFPANGRVLHHLCAGFDSASERFERRQLLTAVSNRHPSCAQLWATFVDVELSLLHNDVRPRVHSCQNQVDELPCDARILSLPCFEEATKQVEASGAARRARSILESALQASACGNCPALWVKYIQLEIQVSRPDAAARVLLRAVQHCPGSKLLWCSAFQMPLIQMLPSKQLVEFSMFMADKEIRSRGEMPNVSDL